MAKKVNLDNDWVGQAREALERTRKDGRPGVARILYCLCRAKARPQRIGTTMKELRDIASKDDTIRARNYLTYARNKFRPGKKCYESRRGYVYYVRRYLARAGLKPEDIGTSKEELEQLNERHPEDI